MINDDVSDRMRSLTLLISRRASLISPTLDSAVLRHVLFLKHPAFLFFLNLRDEILSLRKTTGRPIVEVTGKKYEIRDSKYSRSRNLICTCHVG